MLGPPLGEVIEIEDSAAGALAAERAGLSSTATFVMPFYCDQYNSFEHAVQSVESIVAQTDINWELIIIDDFSLLPRAVRWQQLNDLRSLAPDRVVVIGNRINRGQGVCRNMGVRWAHLAGSPIVLFQDADDIAHPRRLEVTRKVLETSCADFVYSQFVVVNEDGNEPAPEEITPSIAEILEALEHSPAQGLDCWIPILTQTGYLTLTSTVAVSTKLARRHPFPDCRGSEDTHAFLRMSAGGAVFSYQPDIPAKYRIRRDGGSSDRLRIGRRAYYSTKIRIDCDGFEKACELALARGAVTDPEVTTLRTQFRDRLAKTIRREGLADLLTGAW